MASMKLLIITLALVGYFYYSATSHLAHVAMSQANGITSVYSAIAQHPDQILQRY
jgi:hypothetical protein